MSPKAAIITGSYLCLLSGGMLVGISPNFPLPVALLCQCLGMFGTFIGAYALGRRSHSSPVTPL
jgi:membrane protein DedA with SNARE-associated domain